MIYIKLILSALFSGFIVVGGRMIAGEVPPYSAMFIRFAVASLLMFLLLWKRQELRLIKQLSKTQWAAFLGLALSGVIGFNLFMLLGLETVPAARAGVTYGLFPLLTWVAAWLVLREKFTRWSLLGSIVCLGGVLLALSLGSLEFVKNLVPASGDLWLYVSLVCWVTYSLITTWLLRRLNAIFVTALTCIIALLLLFPMAMGEGLGAVASGLEARAWLVFIVQGVLSTTLAFLWYCEGMGKLGAGKATLFLNIMPLGTVFMAAAILGEPLYLAQILGAGLVILGVWLAGRNKLQG